MIGEIVGPYRILEQLGQGGMGIVYKAHDERLDRTVALKFLPPQLSADPRARERFKQEARAASALDHANICAIYDIGQTSDGQVYIVMAYYDGQTLKYRLEDGDIEFAEAIDIVRQMARGLARAHEVGIVHRDIKPANVMVTDRGEVKILDFGLAKLATSADLTKEGSTIGTAAYMSPEQSRGETVDARSDLWSLGVVSYEMLTGRRPFGGGYDAAMLYAILNEEAPPIDRLNPEVPGSVARVIERCLAKDPSSRFDSMSTFLSTLESAAGLSSGSRVEAVAGAVATAVNPTSVGRLISVFAVSAIATLAVVYAAMHFFGLPDWVFAVGVALMVLGLPIILVAGRMERDRAAMDSGERRTLAGLPGWITVRRSAWGGALAMAGLAVVSAGWMTMRALGIGPAGTLVSKGSLSERDFIVIADFENRTQDPNLALSVTEAFRIDLSQSQIVNLLDGATVRDALQRMERDPDALLSADLAREVAVRTGAKAVIVGDVSSVGRSFVLAARLVSAADGSELVALRENAEDDGAILPAIDRLSGRLRERIGESLVSIRGGENLEDVTTASLEALRLYSEGEAVASTGDYARSEELLVRALDLDSTFAMAWRKLSIVRGNANRPLDLILQAAKNAHRLRDRLPERERLLAEANYFNVVAQDDDRTIAAYESVLEKWPDDSAALNNLAIEYRNKRRLDEAEALSRRAMAVAENVVFRQGLILTLSEEEKWDEVGPELDRYVESYPADAVPWIWRARMSVRQGDYVAAAAQLDSAEVRVQDAADRNFVDGTRATIAEMVGKYAEAERLRLAQAERSVQAGYDGSVLSTRLGLAVAKGFVHQDRDALGRTVDELLRTYPLERMNPRNAPAPFVAAILAWTGDTVRAEKVLESWQASIPEEIQVRTPFFSRAFIELERGNRAEALRLMDENRRDQDCPECGWGVQARMYERMDSIDGAIRAFERDLAGDRGFNIQEEEAPTRLHLGSLYDLKGNTDKAIENYSRFVELWKDSDPEFQPYVAQARQEIDRLLREQAREPGAVPSPTDR